jgi:hypothetical protein
MYIPSPNDISGTEEHLKRGRGGVRVDPLPQDFSKNLLIKMQ